MFLTCFTWSKSCIETDVLCDWSWVPVCTPTLKGYCNEGWGLGSTFRPHAWESGLIGVRCPPVLRPVPSLFLRTFQLRLVPVLAQKLCLERTMAGMPWGRVDQMAFNFPSKGCHLTCGESGRVNYHQTWRLLPIFPLGTPRRVSKLGVGCGVLVYPHDLS